MDSTSIDEALVEEREELMLSLIKNSIDEESEAILGPSSSLDIKLSSLSVSFRGWRLPSKNFKLWAEKMSTLHKPTWIKGGIFEAIKSSTYRINKNESLILSLAQKWSLETKTFVFPWGEATITLEDVNVLMGFSILGSSVFAPLESLEMRETVKKLEKQRDKCGVKKDTWISSFENDEIEHEAFLVLWLSNFVFPDKCRVSILSNVFPIAVRLARGERIALAPAVLATLYSDLDLISALASTQNVKVKSLFKLVQVWIWERFKSVRPEAHVIPRDKPRIAQWSGLKQNFEDVELIVLDDFEWRPYTKLVKNWNPSRFYAEEAKWITIGDDDDEFVSFARCVRVSKLVGIGVVEDYYPNRVAMQFGLSQDVPALVTTHQNRNFTENEAWDDYNQSLNGLMIYIPSRLATGSVTARYRDCWIKSGPEIQRATFNQSNIVDYDDDDDDASLKILPLSQILKKLGDGTNKAEDLTNKGYKRARDFRQTPYDEDDNITTAQVMKSRKKCSGGVENHTKGGSSRLKADKSAMECFQTQDKIMKYRLQHRKKCSGDVGNHSRLEADGAKKARTKGHKRARDCRQTQIAEDGNITIARIMKSRKKCSGDVENDTKGGSSRLEADKSAIECFQTQDKIMKYRLQHRKKCSGDVENHIQGGSSRLEADYKIVPVLLVPKNLASGYETVAEATKSVVMSSQDRQVLEKLENGTKKAEHLTNKEHKRARDCRKTQIKEDDVNNTIAHIMKPREKCSDDAEKTQGESSTLEEDHNNVSTFAQYLASRDDTVAAATESVALSLDCNRNTSDLHVASNEVVPLSQVLEKLGNGAKKSRTKGHKRARVCRQTQIEVEDDDDNDITIAQIMKSRKKCSDDVEKTKGEGSRLEADKSAMECFQTQDQIMTSIKKCSGNVENDTEGERSRVEADNNNVSVLPQNLASGDETIVAATKSVALSPLDGNKNSSNLLVASNGVVAEKKDDDERLKQRKVAIQELALKLHARMSKVQTTLAKIKQWKLKRNNTKTQVLA